MRNPTRLLVTVLAMTMHPAHAEELSFQEPDDQITVITRGEEVDIEEWLPEGQVTVVDFFSPYCPPCRAIKGPLIEAVENDEDCALRIVDINREDVEGIDWDSPVARQHEIQGVPFFIIYDPEGNEALRGEEAFAYVQEWLEAGERGPLEVPDDEDGSSTPAAFEASQGMRKLPGKKVPGKSARKVSIKKQMSRKPSRKKQDGSAR